MKILKILLVVIVIILVAVFVLFYLNSRPLTKTAAEERLKNYFEKASAPSSTFSGVQVLIYSETKGINEQFSFGKSSNEADKSLKPNQPFHIASIGKLFTATLVMMLSEEDKIKISDPISKYLDKKTLEGLFVYNNVDYQKSVTIEQLLGHTSGVADYFDDPVKSGKVISELIISEPDTFWTPDMLLDFSRNKQSAVGAPGSGYHYSDTGYILLGLLIEKIENKPFQAVLSDRIFSPLKMDDSYMALRSEPKNQPKKPIADIWFKSVEVNRFTSLSVDWSGGGIISTPNDLLAFQKALHGKKLINSESLATLFNIKNKFQSGIYYGLGTMEIRFEDFFFLLKGMPRLIGHIGILSTHMFYDPTTETHIIMNFGSGAKMVDSFKALIEIVSSLRRIETK